MVSTFGASEYDSFVCHIFIDECTVIIIGEAHASTLAKHGVGVTLVQSGDRGEHW